MKYLKVILQDKYDSVWGHHFLVNANDVAEFTKGKDKRIICTIKGAAPFHCALIPNGKGDFFIGVNKEIRKINQLNVGDEALITITKDDSKYGMPMPEEMKELIIQDPDGDLLFHKLTPGKQRSLLYLIGKPKSSHKRLEKAIVILEHLKVNQGKIDFKMLNQAFKEFKGI